MKDFGLANFNVKAIKVILLAQEEARRLGHNRCGTEQILLGLIGLGDSEASKVLEETGLSLQSGRDMVKSMIGVKEDFANIPWFARWWLVFKEMPFSNSSQEILKFAIQEADELKHSKIGPEHLLLGLLRLSNGRATQILQTAHISKEKLRELLLSSQDAWQN